VPRKILHLLGTAEEEGASISEIVRSLALHLNKNKYEVHAWFLGPHGPWIERLREAGATVEWIDWQRSVRDLKGALRFWTRLGAAEFDIVHQHWGARAVRKLVHLRSKAPIVVHIHGRLQNFPVAIRGADAVITVSRATAMLIPQSRPKVIYTGVKIFDEYAQTEQLHEDEVVIGIACRLIPAKGILDLLHACADLRRRHQRVRLEIAGTGLQREELEREVDRLKMADYVRFLGWVRDLRSTYRGWNVFVLPSLDEGLPIAILEAMAEGLPVIATEVGGVPELVVHGVTGLLVHTSSPSALTEALDQLLRDPDLRRTMGQNARKQVREEFSEEKMARKVETVYEVLLSGPRTRL
jgi:glycosyltransferase involved in cell wall biosynthesis